MKDSYPTKTFRLSEQTIDNLELIVKEERLTYNMLFAKFIKHHFKRTNKQQ